MILVGSSIPPIIRNYYKRKVESNIVARSKSQYIIESDFPIYWAVPEKKSVCCFHSILTVSSEMPHTSVGFPPLFPGKFTLLNYVPFSNVHRSLVGRLQEYK